MKILFFSFRTLFEIIFYLILMVLDLLFFFKPKESFVFFKRLINRAIKRYKIVLKNTKYF